MKKIILLLGLMLFGHIYAQSPLSRFTAVASGANTVDFTSTSDGSPTSFSWEFTGGNPTTSTNSSPSVSYSTAGIYTAKLTVTNSSGSSVSVRTVKVSAGNILDLSSGRNDDGTLMDESGVPDSDWTYTDPNGAVSTPVTRYAATADGWAAASTGGIAGVTRWITGNNTITGNHYYTGKKFEIPAGVITAVLNLRTLSFIRNWTYLVKVGLDGTETETEITRTSWMADGAKGWLNSRSPEVVNYPLTPGTYYIKVRAFTNSIRQRQSIDVNANVDFGSGFIFSPIAEFSASPTSTFVGSNVQFTNLSQGTSISTLWKFEDGANALTSTQNNPIVVFSTAGNHYVELSVDYNNSLTSSLKINNYIQVTKIDAPVVSVIQPDCSVPSGSITVTSPASGVTYSFDNGSVFQASNSISGLSSGIYQVKVKTPEGAVSEATSVTINPAPAVPETPVLMVTQPTCPINTGSITVTSPASGIEYSFDGGVTYQTSNTKSGLQAGIYQITVKNSNGCTSMISVTIDSGDCKDWTRAPNSYIFDPSQNNNGLYIPVKKAYAMWKDENGLLSDNTVMNGSQTAEVYWEDVAGLISSTNYNLVIDGSGEDAKIKVEIDKTKGEGNAVVALKINNKIVWSWHVWVTDDPSNGTTDGERKFMDRNLGATSAKFLGNDWNKSGGLMYQWGRKDPFPPLKYKDELAYFASGTIGIKKHPKYQTIKNELISWPTINYTPNPDAKINIRYTVENPAIFLKNSDVSLNWWGANNNDLWRNDRTKSAYDPCPYGYRVAKSTVISSTSKLTKIHPSLGANTNIGLMPHTGVMYYNTGEWADNYSEAHIAVSNGALESSGQPSEIKMISDSHNIASGFGTSSYGIQSISNEGSSSFSGTACRCEIDPDKDPKSDFGKPEYLPGSTTTNYNDGINNPNSIIAMTNGANDSTLTVTIPLNKAYAVYNQYFTDFEDLNKVSGQRAVSVYWTDNATFASGDGDRIPLVNTILRTGTGSNTDDMIVTLNPNQYGNAVVALHRDGINSEVLWSWHIWAPKVDPSVNQDFSGTPTQVTYITEPVLPYAGAVNPTTSGFPPLTTTFMNMNLGALNPMPTVTTQTSDPTILSDIKNSGGLHYQWGRKDPLPAPVQTPIIYRQTGVNNNQPIYNESVRLEKDGDWNWTQERYPQLGRNPRHFSDYTNRYSERYDNYIAGGSTDVVTNGGNGWIEAGSTVNNEGAKVKLTDNIFVAARKVLKYSAEKPLTFLFQKENGWIRNGGQRRIPNEGGNSFRKYSLDWISDYPGLMSERWGHANKKSPFDPCPAGWRIPDASLGKITGEVSGVGSAWDGKGMRGNSPWYYSHGDFTHKGIVLKNFGFSQFSGYPVLNSIGDNNYPGIGMINKGWIFNNSQFTIGNIPATGIRGSTGGNNFNTPDGSITYNDDRDYNYRTGLWTSTLGDESGHAMSLEIINNRVMNAFFSGSSQNPMAAMGCRCVKDEPRVPEITPSSGKKMNNSTKTILEETSKVEVFPNPVIDYLNINSNESLEYFIFNLNGTLINQGKLTNKQINMSSLPTGMYMLKLVQPKDKKMFIYKIIKK